jgi:hypothetical protein
MTGHGNVIFNDAEVINKKYLLGGFLRLGSAHVNKKK